MRSPAPLCELALDGIAHLGKVPERVLEVDLAQNFVRKADAVDVVAAVARRTAGGADLRRMKEVLVEGLQKPPVRRPEVVDRAARVAVGAEEDPVLVLEEERPPETGRAAQILNRRRRLEVGVGIGVQERREPPRVVVQHSHVAEHETRPGMLREHVLTGVLDHLPRRARLVQVAARVPRATPQAGLVALVQRADGIEAPHGVAGVDHDRHVVPGGHRPDGVEEWIVGLNEGAIGVARSLAQRLGHLQAPRAGKEPPFHLARHPLGPAGLVDAVEVQGDEVHNPVTVRLPRRQRGVEALSGPAVQVDDRSHPDGVHEGDQALVRLGRRELPGVHMEVDGRESGPRDVRSREPEEDIGHGRLLAPGWLPALVGKGRLQGWHRRNPDRALGHPFGCLRDHGDGGAVAGPYGVTAFLGFDCLTREKQGEARGKGWSKDGTTHESNLLFPGTGAGAPIRTCDIACMVTDICHRVKLIDFSIHGYKIQRVNPAKRLAANGLPRQEARISLELRSKRSNRMLIKVPRGWEIPEHEATPEKCSYPRRSFFCSLQD